MVLVLRLEMINTSSTISVLTKEIPLNNQTCVLSMDLRCWYSVYLDLSYWNHTFSLGLYLEGYIKLNGTWRTHERRTVCDTIRIFLYHFDFSDQGLEFYKSFIKVINWVGLIHNFKLGVTRISLHKSSTPSKEHQLNHSRNTVIHSRAR